MALGWAGRPATDIAAAVREGAATAVDVVAAHLAVIAERDPKVGAFQLVRAARALAEAAEVDRRADRRELPLAGVPVAVKDNVALTGEPARDGSAASSGEPAVADHPVVARLRAAGAVVVGVTRVPELCVWPFTDGPFGTARNPWDPSRTPGGSSGGSAAAVAAGMVPLAHGNDGLGSIRIPAAACGLVGIKPGFGLVPALLGADSWSGLAENGPLTTTVADAALALSVLAADRSLAAPAVPSGVRVAVATKAPLPGGRVDREWAAAAVAAGEAFVRLGHDVGTAAPPAPLSASLAVLARWYAGAAADADDLATRPGFDRSGLQPRTRRHIAFGRIARPLLRPSARERWRAALAPFFDRHDVLVTPTLAGPPVVAAPWAARGWAANVTAATRMSGGFSAPWNLAGWPSIAVPAGAHSSGTPLSVQLTAPLGRESLLLGLAAQLERTRPWERHPPVFR